jgi:hypothetical protein
MPLLSAGVPWCHGAMIAEATLERTVLVSISLMTNAELQMRSRLLTMTQDGRDPRHLRPR